MAPAAIISRLETERLVLRPPARRDEAAYVAFYGSDRRAKTAERIDADTARRRFNAVLDHWREKGFGRFIVERRDQDGALGLIGPHDPDDYPEGEIAWHIWEDHGEGKGLAYEAARASLDYAFGTLGWTTAVSYIWRENTRSIRLAKRLGAAEDPLAAVPDWLGETYAVYRHPRPEARA